MTRKRIRSIACLLLLTAALPACESYSLRGKVIGGPAPNVEVVDADDPRLEHPGLGAAVVRFTVDPNEMRPHTYGPTVTDDDGRFDIPVSETGAGFLEYELEVVGQRKGYENLWKTLPMPGGNKRLLIVLTPGQGGYVPDRTNVLRETERIGEQFK